MKNILNSKAVHINYSSENKLEKGRGFGLNGFCFSDESLISGNLKIQNPWSLLGLAGKQKRLPRFRFVSIFLKYSSSFQVKTVEICATIFLTSIFKGGFFSERAIRLFKSPNLKKQDSKELSPRPLENAPKTFTLKNSLSFLMLKGGCSLIFGIL